MNLPLLKRITFLLLVFITNICLSQSRSVVSFNDNWKFYLWDNVNAQSENLNDASWRKLNLPHDWSIELPFDSTSPTGTGGGALRGGLGWYRKTFTVPSSLKGKKIFIDFDGVYMNSEVFINGHSLGVRPNGYISFRYDLTPYLGYDSENAIMVKVDNSKQPNSRWYSGSGIYRNVWLVTVNNIYVDKWGTQITTPNVSAQSSDVVITSTINNAGTVNENVVVKTTLYDAASNVVGSTSSTINTLSQNAVKTTQRFKVNKPNLWSVDNPYMYKAVTQIVSKGKIIDEYTTNFGIRYFSFDVDKGFFLNGKHLKIRGVCNHHDLGFLGTAINTRALERQLQILKDMGCNGIRTSHNPPAPELLDLCDKMGFIVMDEAFDMWKHEKNPYDYHLFWDEWHKKDLTDQVLRDRNHPSVFMWSVGNEIYEQYDKDGDTSGAVILRELVGIVKSLDDRPTVTANNEPANYNRLLKTNVTDLIGYNYHHEDWDSAQIKWYRKPFIVTESVSALQTRGHYDMPSDSIRRWPQRWDKPLENGNDDLTCSAYENCATPWGSTHEETLKIFEKRDHISGMFIWTGFDYIGEPTPYPWPARSSYFGIVDLAGFPKDAYYLYQSLWTNKPVLHILPHWNWKPGQTIDVWAYYNNADEVELFINGKSLGIKKKTGEDLHVMWRTTFEPGTLKAVSRKNGKVVLTREIKTAGTPVKIVLQADRKTIKADGNDLSFITVRIEDKDGNLVPGAANEVQFSLTGNAFIAGVDNGCQTSMESFKADHRKAFNGLCLAVVQSSGKVGKATLTATSAGLNAATISVDLIPNPSPKRSAHQSQFK